jgi:hypothetical protein
MMLPREPTRRAQLQTSDRLWTSPMPDDSKAAGALLVSLRAIWAPLVTSESFLCVFDRRLIADFAPNKNADHIF